MFVSHFPSLCYFTKDFVMSPQFSLDSIWWPVLPVLLPQVHIVSDMLCICVEVMVRMTNFSVVVGLLCCLLSRPIQIHVPPLCVVRIFYSILTY